MRLQFVHTQRNKSVRYPEFRVPNYAKSIRFAVLLPVFAGMAFATGTPAELGEEWQKLMYNGVKAASLKNYEKAEDQLAKAVSVGEQFSAGDPRAGMSLNALGLVYREEKKYSDAEKAFEKGLGFFEKAYGPYSLETGNANFNVASAQLAEDRYEAALPYILKSRAVYQKILGSDSGKTALTSCMLGSAYRNLQKFNDAEEPLKACAAMRESTEGVDSPELASALFDLALVYEHQGKFNQADPRMKMAEKIRELKFGMTSPQFIEVLEAHAALLRLMNKDADAAKAEAMLTALRRLTPKGN